MSWIGGTKKLEERVLVLEQESEERKNAHTALQKEVDTLRLQRVEQEKAAIDLIEPLQVSVDAFRDKITKFERDLDLANGISILRKGSCEKCHNLVGGLRKDLDALSRKCEVLECFFPNQQSDYLQWYSHQSFDVGQVTPLKSNTQVKPKVVKKTAPDPSSSGSPDCADLPLDLWTLDEGIYAEEKTHASTGTESWVVAVEQERPASAANSAIEATASPNGCNSEANVIETCKVLSESVGNTIMIRNLPCSATEQDVKNYLRVVGFQDAVLFCHLPKRANKKGNLGYGFVCLASTEDAVAMTNEIQGKPFPGANETKLLQVSPARIQGMHENIQNYYNVEAARRERQRREKHAED